MNSLKYKYNFVNSPTSVKIALMNTLTYALECQTQFLHETRTEPYQEYGEGVLQWKIGSGAKKSGIVQAMPELRRIGA